MNAEERVRAIDAMLADPSEYTFTMLSLARFDCELHKYLKQGALLEWEPDEARRLVAWLDDRMFDPPMIENAGGWAA
jgi:hypothetical protein